MQVLGFDWDEGNREKCLSHGLSPEEIESIFYSEPHIMVNSRHDSNEERFHAVGMTPAGRYTFIVFTYRVGEEGLLIRPISARYMHNKEVEHYERQKKS